MKASGFRLQALGSRLSALGFRLSTRPKPGTRSLKPEARSLKPEASVISVVVHALGIRLTSVHDMELDQFTGINAAYVLELYERYLKNRESVDPAARAAFENWRPAEPETRETSTRQPPPFDIHAIVGAAGLS